MSSNPSIVALIPARVGSKRVPGKNIRTLAGHPLIAYTIAAAIDSHIFSEIIVSTDSDTIAEIARYYGAQVPFLRSPEYAGDTSPDIEWVEETLKRLQSAGRVFDCFSILRPSSPFRQPETIERAWEEFKKREGIDSLRAVEKCKQHPGKMWVIQDKKIIPLLTGNEPSLSSHKGKSMRGESNIKELAEKVAPLHSSPYQILPEVYIQNASLEIAWCRVVWEKHSIAGDSLMPLFTRRHEGLDINDEKDWWYVEHLLQEGEAKLPIISKPPIVQD